MVGRADYHSVFIKWFETKAWHTEKETIEHVLDGFLKRETAHELGKLKESEPFTKMILKRTVEKTNPQFQKQITDKISIAKLSHLLNRLVQEMSTYLFGCSYQDLPSEEHRLFILENLDLTPREVKSLLSAIAHQFIKRIHLELSNIQHMTVGMIESILSRDEFSKPHDFWFHIYILKKSYENIKEQSITLNDQLISNLFLDYKRSIHQIERAHDAQSEYLKLTGVKNNLKLNLVILPPNIGYLHQLKILLLNQNRLSFLPPAIGDLIHLQQLNLQMNCLAYLPHTFSNLTKLTHLILRQNLLEDLPNDFEKLTELRVLDLAINQFSYFPYCLHALGSLNQLNLSFNFLKNFPLKARNHPNLSFLGIIGTEVSLVESQELNILRSHKCTVKGGKTLSLLEAIPEHLFLLLLTFLPWQSLNRFTLLNKYFNHHANNLINYRSQISKQCFFEPFEEIDEIEKNFLTRHLNLTHTEISIKLTQILQNIERICKIIQDDVLNYIDVDSDGNKIEPYPYTIDDIKNGLSYSYFQDDQEAFLNHLKEFLQSVDITNRILETQDTHTTLAEAFYAYEHCCHQINHARKNSKKFSFVNSTLTLIPPEISKLKNLQKLTLIELFLSSLPEHLKDLPLLTKVYLNGNLFTEIPSVLFQCKNLKTLAIMKNAIRTIPDNIQDLQNLEILSCQQNYIETLTESISALPHLKTLILNENPINTLPRSITSLPSLTALKIDLKWENLSPQHKRWLLRLKQENLKVIGIKIPDHLLAIPEIVQAIQNELKSIHHFKTLNQIEESFSSEIFGNNLDAFLSYLKQFYSTVEISNRLIHSEKKHQINPTELSYAYKGYELCLGYIHDTVRSRSSQFTLLNTFNTLNTLTFLPLKIRDLKHVKHMDLQNNRLTFVHREIWSLPLLEIVALGNNQLTQLPDGINKPLNLRVLSLHHNPISTLPKGIHKTNLNVFELDNTAIQWKNLSKKQEAWLRNSIERGVTTGIRLEK